MRLRKLNKYYLILIVPAIMFVGVLHAQDGRVPFSKRQYLYIQHDSSVLEHFDTNPNLEKFFDKLDK